MSQIIPNIVNVADIQRGYREIVNKAKKTREPVIIVNNGKPEMVLIEATDYDQKMSRLWELEEESLLKAAEEAISEYQTGKTVTWKKGQKIADL